jgi:membrane protein YdbS with pleckstrin-like domain
MKPWIHPQERRARIYWWIQIVIVVVVLIAAPVLLLREPTLDHVVIVAGIVVIGLISLFIGIKVLRKLPDEYKYEAEDEDSNNKPK